MPSDPQPLIDSLPVKTELFDVEMMSYLGRCEEVPSDIKKKLKAYRKMAIKGNNVRVSYEFGKVMKPLQKGRLVAFGGLSLQDFRSDIRSALGAKYYWDVDMANAQPVILVQLCKQRGWACPRLEEYVLNRASKLQEIMSTLGCDRASAKQFCLSILFGSLKYKTISPYFAELTNELDMIAKNCMDAFPEIVKQVIRDKEKNNVKASTLAHVAQCQEAVLLNHLDAFLHSQNRYMATLIYDGGLVLKEDYETEFPQELLRNAENYIFDKSGYRITLTADALENTFTVEDTEKLVPRNVIINDLFASQKFAELCGDDLRKVNGQVYVRNETGRWGCDVFALKSKIISLASSLIWKQEGLTGIRTFDYGGVNKNINILIENAQFYAKEGALPVQFEYEFINNESSNKEAALEYFNTLLNIVSNGNEKVRDYILKYLAHILQKPLDYHGVCLIITGPKGCGKDTLFDFFMKCVIGELYSFNYNKTKQLFEKHDVGRLNKFIVKVEEADRKVCMEHSSELKSMITSPTQSFEPKNKSIMEVKNYCRMIFTTNKDNPVDMSENERRFLLTNASGEMVGNLTFWNQLREVLFNPESGKVIAQYLLDVDVSTFNARDIPKCDYQEYIEDKSISIEDLFLEQLVLEEWVKMNELFELYRSFCSENAYNAVDNSRSLGHRLSNAVRDGKLKAKRGNAGMLYRK